MSRSQDILVSKFKDEFIDLPVIQNELVTYGQNVPLDFKVCIKVDLELETPSPYKAVESKLSFYRHKIIALSLLAHIIMLAVVMLISNTHKTTFIEKLAVQAEPKPLKSFLYYAPKLSTQDSIKPEINNELEIKTAAKSMPENITEPVAKPVPVLEKNNQQAIKKLATEKELVKNIEVDETSQNKEILDFISQSAPRQDNQSKATLTSENSNAIVTPKSNMEHLSDLRKRLNSQAMQALVDEQYQVRSPSVMHGKEIPVPHSTKQLTAIEEKEKNTMKMSDEISITRLGNGYCIIERDQALGSPIPASSSGFACGKSDFDKSFKEHMKKVSNKLAPKKTQNGN